MAGSKAKKLALAGLLLGSLLLAQTPARAEGVAEPEGYRGEPYRSPTPDTLRGARVLSTGDAEAIWKSRDAIFVDVLPRAPRPAGLPPGTIWREKPRRNIPGSIWLPDTGYDALAATTENYLRNNLARVTGGDKARLLVIYCLRDCWMSWNAAQAYPRDGIQPLSRGIRTAPTVGTTRCCRWRNPDPCRGTSSARAASSLRADRTERSGAPRNESMFG